MFSSFNSFLDFKKNHILINGFKKSSVKFSILKFFLISFFVIKNPFQMLYATDHFLKLELDSGDNIINLTKKINNHPNFNHLTYENLHELTYKNKDFFDLTVFCSLLRSENIPKDLFYYFKDSKIVDKFLINFKQYFSSYQNQFYFFSIDPQAHNLFGTHFKFSLKQQSFDLTSIIFSLNQYIQKCIQNENYVDLDNIRKHMEYFFTHPPMIKKEHKNLLKIEWAGLHLNLGHYIKADNILKKILVNLHQYDHKAMTHILMYAAITARELGHFKESKDLLEQNISIFKKNLSDSEYLKILAYLGLVYRELGLYEQARDCLQQTIALCHENPLIQRELAQAYAYLGIVYRDLKDYKAAILSINHSLSLYEHLSPNVIGMARALGYQGIVERELGQYVQARKSLEKCLQLSEIHMPENHNSIIWTMVHLGHVFKDQELYQDAESILEKSLEKGRHYYPLYHIRLGWNLLPLGMVYQKLGKPDLAKDAFEECLNIYKKSYGESHMKTKIIQKQIEDLTINNF